ncbi:phosphoenolpyruvate synthase [Pseudohongiella spirulinae]|uniref:Phosphoenolpyruvate synthase n=1 Tax=Pseudohongiella spirulinae TaxID=1249552 RepID=A0A0S2KCU7_9GAMM|nr:phosphoenolpyruvate synthase [Pseudohongiella spirulinae]ALO45934.1 phosphoenolpyruvate synthase [Pseudohongiella spirulinae]
MPEHCESVILFDALDRTDLPRVGGKNASLGEMISRLGAAGVLVPPGFATTSEAYWRFVESNNLRETLSQAIDAFQTGDATLALTGKLLRDAFLRGRWPDDIADAISTAYGDLCLQAGGTDVPVAVRSSATAEDLPDASFAGQQETFLNISGQAALLDACRRCFASLFTDRAISYRETHGFDHLKVALSVGVQLMVRSDVGGAGVMFSIDTETGFEKVVVIDAAWGLGETVVQGSVDPDEYLVFKPLLSDPELTPIVQKRRGTKRRKMVYAPQTGQATQTVDTSPAEREQWVLSDAEILQLARWACVIELHYGCPMDMEWAKDGESGRLYIVQARPETVQSRRALGEFRSYRLSATGPRLVSGLSIGEAAVSGQVCRLESARDIDRFVDGAILVTGNTDPDWVPVMKRAVAIVTDHGGRTSHAAIISRELGLPAVVGTGNATELLRDGQSITVSCAEGDQGHIYEGVAQIDSVVLDTANMAETRTKIMLNLADPAAAFRWWRLPADGVGLVRMEFVISNHIKVHPMALVKYAELSDEAARREIDDLTAGYNDKSAYFVDSLARGLARIAAAFYPHPAIIRMSDFKTNEYASLIGGAQFEPPEENPMLGFRGASRYYSPRYQAGFALECLAIKKLREELGFSNVIVMIPFCRTVGEADKVLDVMAQNGLVRGENGLQVYVMCEIPSNVILAEEFATRFDGFSIGSNDLTQLTLGIDRDSEDLADLFDEDDPAVKWMISRVIGSAHKAGVKVGLCGQAPSNRPAFAAFLVESGIDSISVTPDSFVSVKMRVADMEGHGQ